MFHVTQADAWQAGGRDMLLESLLTVGMHGRAVLAAEHQARCLPSRPEREALL